MSDENALRLLGEIVDRQAQRICEIAGVPQSEDGDADFQLAWDRLYEMRDEVSRLRARVAELEGQVQRVREIAAHDVSTACPLPCGGCADDQCEGEGLKLWIWPASIRAALDGSEPTP